MRRTRRVAVLAAAVLGALGAGGTGVAHADVLLLEVAVQFESAPATGELVRGVREVSGYAEAAEGVARVDLYVVEHSLGRPLTDSVPVATFRPSMPLGRAHFDFAWDSAKTPAGLVDVAIVATSTTSRTGEARVLSVRVKHAAQQVTQPVAPKPSARKASVSAKAAPSGRAAARPAAPVAARASVARLAVSPKVEAAQARQAAAFYGSLAAAEAAAAESVAAPAAAPESVLAPLARASRGAWPSVAVGLILLVAAGHVQRAVRVQLA